MTIVQAIKNFILAVIICRKYKLTYKPLCTFNNSEYNYIYRHIKLNPFHPEFISILFHEVGHHVHDKMVNYNIFFNIKPDSMKGVTYNDEQDYYKLMEAEAFASRFAMKTGRADKAFLVYAFNTYSQLPFKQDEGLSTRSYFMDYIDCISKNTVRIINH